jgi:predicted metal-binding protein
MPAGRSIAAMAAGSGKDRAVGRRCRSGSPGDAGPWPVRVRDAGADGSCELDAGAIVFADWVRLKCRYGCPEFGRRLSCPPYTPPLEELSAAFAGYSRALLVWVEVDGADEEPAARRRLHEALLELERAAFVDGHHKALALGVGPCLWCGDEPCPADGSCRQRERLRPSLSGCGIDVFATAADAGVELRVAADERAAVKLLGLLLIE